MTNSVTTPLVKEKIEDLESEEDVELRRDEAEEYRSVAMRAAYLGQGTCNVQPESLQRDSSDQLSGTRRI